MIPTNIQLQACAFCERATSLRNSHVVPRFVWDWLKRTSATGYLRQGTNVDKRQQDGWKERLLCTDCEQLFGLWEKRTSELVFIPLHDQDASILNYDEWMGKFCASICWRVLYLYRHIGLTHLSPELKASADFALGVWKQFLLDARRDVGTHELHFLPVGPVDSARTEGTAPNLNRYLMRSVDVDVACDSRSAFVYVKMCRFMLFGFISVSDGAHWEGTRVSIPAGIISPRQYVLPSSVGEFLNDRAANCLRLQESMSDRQRTKLDAWMLDNADTIANSESFRAMMHDVDIFGNAAFSKSPNKPMNPSGGSGVS